MQIFDSIADITHYDTTGSEVVTGGNFLPGQFFKSNEMQVVKTVVDFGSGKTITRMRNQITIAGKLSIERSFENKILTEKVEMQGLSLNDVSIHGTKFIQRSFDPDKGEAHTQMVVEDANIVFENGEVGSWNSESSRKVLINSKTANGPTFSQFVSESNTSITMEDGSVFYSHETLKPLVTNMDCPNRKLVSGILEICYEGNLINVDYGDGECQSQMNITVATY